MSTSQNLPEEYIPLYDEASTSQNLLNNNNNNKDGEDTIESSTIIENPIVVPKKKERIYWIDCLRVFASMVVVFHHTTFTDVPPLTFDTHNWLAIYFYNTFTRPCVPLFIMISGVFFLNPEKNVTIESIWKKSLFRIMKSYIFWSIYYNVFDLLVVNFNHGNYEYNKTLVIEVTKRCILGLGHLWYLNFVMGLYVTTPIYREAARNTKVAIYTAALSIFISQFLPTVVEFIKIFMGLDLEVFQTFVNLTMSYAALGYINYFMLGYLLGCFDLEKKVDIYLTYVIGIVGIVGTTLVKFAAAYKLKENNNHFGEYNHFNVCMSTVGIFCFFKYFIGPRLNRLMENRNFKTILMTLSDCSYGVYLVHMTVYHLLLRFGVSSITFDPLFWIPIYAAIIYSISFCLIYYMRKLSILREVT